MTALASWLLLVLFVAAQGVALGAGMYEQRIVVPQWFGRDANGDPYLREEAMRAADTGRRFWGFVTTGPLTLLVLISIVAAVRTPGPAQAWWLGSAVIALLERCATLGYFITTAIRLMRAQHPVPSALAVEALQWGNFNRLRIALSAVAYVLGMLALAPPG